MSGDVRYLKVNTKEASGIYNEKNFQTPEFMMQHTQTQESFNRNFSVEFTWILANLSPKMKEEIAIIEGYCALKGKNPAIQILDYLFRAGQIDIKVYQKEFKRLEIMRHKKVMALIQKIEKLKGRDPLWMLSRYMQLHGFISKNQFQHIRGKIEQQYEGLHN